MRRLSVALIAAVCVIALPQIASAAEPVYNWTGPSIGTAGGYGWGNSSQTDSGVPCTFFGTCGPAIPVVIPEDGSYSADGGIVGGMLGYDQQNGPWVFGVQGDLSWADISGSSNTCGASSPIPHSCGAKLESLATLRGRIGYAVAAAGNWLPYVTGGFAAGQLKAWDALYPSSGRDLRAGWTVGAGVEAGITQHWTLKVEYLYVDLGSREMFNVVPGVPESVDFTANIIRVGISYRLF